MKLRQNLIVFFIAFSGVFYFVRSAEFYNSQILLADIGGVPWLYSTIGTIFSILAAFVIQKEWERWNNLVATVQGEVGALEELWLWSKHFPEKLRVNFEKTITEYLETVIEEGLQKSEFGEKNNKTEKALSQLHDAFYEIFENDRDLLPSSFAIFSELLSKRSERLHYASHEIPIILKNTLLFATGLLVVLSFFIGIKNIFINYLFTMSIAFLAFTIFMVIDDLDRPLRPGGWHLTPKKYKELLAKIKSKS